MKSLGLEKSLVYIADDMTMTAYNTIAACVGGVYRSVGCDAALLL